MTLRQTKAHRKAWNFVWFTQSGTKLGRRHLQRLAGGLEPTEPGDLTADCMTVVDLLMILVAIWVE